MNPEIEVEVFRAGDYGPRGSYGESDLDAIAEDYSTEIHEAPVTVDHKQDGPALGWVRSLRRVGSVLLARIGDLDEAFREKLRGGAFKKRSVELYRRAEATDRPYLRALTFLGAGSPVVKGLADPVFREDAEKRPSLPGACVWIAFEEEAPVLDEPESAEAFGEIDEPTRQTLEDLERSGRILPAWRRNGIDRFFASLDDTIPRSFSEDDDGLTARAWFARFLGELAPLVPFGEAAAPELRDTRATMGLPIVDVSDPRAARLDPRSVALHESAVRYGEAHPEASYAESLRAVCTG